MIRRLRQALCAHPALVRERRTVDDVPNVLCVVCPSCGYVQPLISRSPDERRQVHAAGKVIEVKGQRATKDNVTPLRKTGTR